MAVSPWERLEARLSKKAILGCKSMKLLHMECCGPGYFFWELQTLHLGVAIWAHMFVKTHQALCLWFVPFTESEWYGSNSI